MSKTEVKIYKDFVGNQHYDFTIDKEHMDAMQTGNVWTEVETKTWEHLQHLPDEDFFKKAFSFSILLRLLHNHAHLSESISQEDQDHE